VNIIVTSGPTREAIDPVRFISNHSSGKMGYALAEEGRDRGYRITLISGPVCLSDPDGIEVVRVVSAEEMCRAVVERIESCDCLIMAAAVADWRPAFPSDKKIKKDDGGLTLELEPAPDILRSVSGRKGKRIFVGFAAETGDPFEEAKRKLVDKNLDMIVANDVSLPDSGFGSDKNRISIITASERRDYPLMSKRDCAKVILEWVEGNG